MIDQDTMNPASSIISLNTSKEIKKIFKLKGKRIKFKDYLSELTMEGNNGDVTKDKIRPILTDNENYNLIAPMGAGKTSTILQIVKTDNIKAVFTVPLIANLRQLKKKHKAAFHYYGGETPGDKILQELSPSDPLSLASLSPDALSFICVYDSLSKVINRSDFRVEEFILIIDEMHNLFLQSNFRYDAIHYLSEQKLKFKKIINITGTPEGIFVGNNNFTSIIFERKSNTEVSKPRLSIVTHKKDIEKKIIDHIKSANHTGKVIILYNDKKKITKFIEKLQVIFGEKLKSDGKRISELTAKNRDSSPDFEYIFKEQKLPDDIQYLITTSVISDGVNIKDKNIDAIYFINCKDYWLKRQFISRFRLGVKEILDFQNSNSHLLDWINIKKFYAMLYKNGKKNVEGINKSIRLFSDTIIDPKVETFFNSIGLFLDEEKKAFWLSGDVLGYLLIKKLNSILWSDTSKAISYYNVICEYDANIISYDELMESVGLESKLTTQENEKLESLKLSSTESLTDLIENHIKPILTTYIRQKDPELFMSGRIDRSIYTEEEYPRFDDLKKSTKVKDLITKAFGYLKDGYSVELVKFLMHVHIQQLNRTNTRNQTQPATHLLKINVNLYKFALKNKFISVESMALLTEKNLLPDLRLVSVVLKAVGGKSVINVDNFKRTCTDAVDYFALRNDQLGTLAFKMFNHLYKTGTESRNTRNPANSYHTVKIEGQCTLKEVLTTFGIELQKPRQDNKKMVARHLINMLDDSTRTRPDIKRDGRYTLLRNSLHRHIL